CGCNKYVPFSAVRWEETGQTLAEYFHELQRQAVRDGRVNPPSSAFLPVATLILLFSTVGGGAIAQKAGGNGGLGALCGSLLGAACVFVVWIIMRSMKRSPSPQGGAEKDAEADRPRE